MVDFTSKFAFKGALIHFLLIFTMKEIQKASQNSVKALYKTGVHVDWGCLKITEYYSLYLINIFILEIN